jgi:two-component system, chemotaxis family, protein-glutamate methylesterase/glutaminase
VQYHADQARVANDRVLLLSPISTQRISVIRVVIVDDVSTVRMALKQILTTDGDMQVVGQGRHGRDAVALVHDLRPDIVLMDVDMPQMDGLEATERIMSESATPILIVTSSAVYDARGMPFSAIESGALDVFPKPSITDNRSWQNVGDRLRRTVRTLSRVKVVSRRRKRQDNQSPAPARHGVLESPVQPAPTGHGTRVRLGSGNFPRLVAIGTSTGGPLVIRQILENLDAEFQVPMVLVQHIGDEFVHGLVEWLDRNAPVRVVLAGNKQQIEPGTMAVAPGGIHIRVDDALRIRYFDGPMVHHCKPSVDVMFHSVAKNIGQQSLAVLLTGMGRDGAEGLRAVRACGGTTIAQDQATSVVFGMPGAAVELGAAQHVLSPAGISEVLLRLVRENGKTSDA